MDGVGARRTLSGNEHFGLMVAVCGAAVPICCILRESPSYNYCKEGESERRVVVGGKLLERGEKLYFLDRNWNLAAGPISSRGAPGVKLLYYSVSRNLSPKGECRNYGSMRGPPHWEVAGP